MKLHWIGDTDAIAATSLRTASPPWDFISHDYSAVFSVAAIINYPDQHIIKKENYTTFI
jgi:hypothetical protein